MANDVSRSDAGFDVDTNAVTIIGAAGTEIVPLQSKNGVAAEVLNRIEALLASVRVNRCHSVGDALQGVPSRDGLKTDPYIPAQMRDQIVEHLKFAAELGVTGVSKDSAWRARLDPVPTSADASPAEAAAPAVEPVAFFDAETLAAIKADIGDDCRRCKLHTLGRKQIVFGVGNPDADLMFVGRRPAPTKISRAIPFVGRAGQLLTKIIEAIGLTRDDVYIANVIKCRPPQNRNPEPDEVETCEPFLFRQIDAIKPKVIVALGKFAARTLLRTTAIRSRVCAGRVHDFRGAKLIPTFHPAYLLRNPSSKREVWEDMKMARGLLQASGSGLQAPGTESS